MSHLQPLELIKNLPTALQFREVWQSTADVWLRCRTSECVSVCVCEAWYTVRPINANIHRLSDVWLRSEASFSDVCVCVGVCASMWKAGRMPYKSKEHFHPPVFNAHFQIVHEKTGVQMPEIKKTKVEILQKSFSAWRRWKVDLNKSWCTWSTWLKRLLRLCLHWGDEKSDHQICVERRGGCNLPHMDTSTCFPIGASRRAGYRVATAPKSGHSLSLDWLGFPHRFSIIWVWTGAPFN